MTITGPNLRFKPSVSAAEPCSAVCCGWCSITKSAARQLSLLWPVLQECDFMPVLMALASLARGHADLAAAADGSAGGDQSRKVSAVGLVDPPLHAVVAAVSANRASSEVLCPT